MRKFAIVYFYIFICCFVSAQSNLPFISEIHAEQKNNKIFISWKNSNLLPDKINKIVVYKSNEKFTRISLSLLCPIAEIPVSSNNFEDTVSESGSFYYAVFYKDKDGNIYNSLLPLSNYLLSPITVNTVPNLEKTQTLVTSISTTVKEDKIYIRFSCSNTNTKLFLYRSTKPFRTQSDLTNAILVKSFFNEGNLYIDTPVPQIKYYYALIDEKSLQKNSYTFQEGKNTTPESVFTYITSSGEYSSQLETKKIICLPFLNIPFENENKRIPLSKESITKIKKIIRQVSKKTTKDPYFFDSAFYDDKEMGKKVNQLFVSGAYTELESFLINYLRVIHSDNNTFTALFYLGEAYYFQEKYTDALFTFLRTRDFFYDESNQWITSTLNNM